MVEAREGVLARGGGVSVSECVKLRRQTFDIFTVKTPNYKPNSSVFSLGGYKQHPSPYPNLNASKFISLLLNFKKDTYRQRKEAVYFFATLVTTYKPISFHNPDAK
jgi:hypothetical protein